MSRYSPSAIRDVYVFVRRGPEVLLLLRSGTGYRDGQWGPPAGRVEPHETYADAAARELAEEVGLAVAAEALAFVHLLDRVAERGEHWIGAFFAAELAAGTPRNREPAKHSDMRWFGPDEIPPTTVDYVRGVISRVAAGRAYSVWHEDPGSPTGSTP